MVKRDICLCYLLLLTVCFQLSLPLTWSFRVDQVRRSQREYIRRNFNRTTHFQRFEFSPEEFRELKIVSGEFIYQNMRYDIRSVKAVHGKYLIYALADPDETRICKNTNITSNSLFKFPDTAFAYYEEPKNMDTDSSENCPEPGFTVKKIIAVWLEVIPPPPDRALLY